MAAGENSTEGMPRSICDSCERPSGGETSDFPGDPDPVCCDYQASAVSLDDPRAVQLQASRFASWLEGTHEAPFRWQREWRGTCASGYVAASQLQLDVQISKLSVIEANELEEAPPGCESFVCEDSLQFNLNVDVSLSDGALQGSQEVIVFAQPGDEELHTTSGYFEGPMFGVHSPPAHAPLESYRGTLNFGLPERRHSGRMEFSAVFGADEFRGRLIPKLSYVTSEPADRLPFSLARTFAPLVGQWPVLSCPGGSPVPNTETLDTTLGLTPVDLFNEFRSAVRNSFPVSGRWLDGSSTDVHLEVVGELDLSCLEVVATESYGLHTQLHIQTADGKLDTTQPAVFRTRLENGGYAWTLEVETETMPVSEFQDRVGLREVDFRTDKEARLVLRADASAGDLQIHSLDQQRHNRGYLHWCTREDCSNYPDAFYVE